MTKYDRIILAIFQAHYHTGDTTVSFRREELSQKAQELGITTPKNLGDIVYSYKYRNSLPNEIISTAPVGFSWRIKNVGRGLYEFTLAEGIEFIEPDKLLATTKIPDATPSIVREYSLSDEQALLAIVRYNRLLDIFLGIACYSLQNHLRTTVAGIGQVETDELYIGIDKGGRQYIIPVQAKGGTDKLGISQIEQDLALCKEKYPNLIRKSIACQFITKDTVAIFEFSSENGEIVKVAERHYRIVNATEISPADLQDYCLHR